MYNIMCLYMCGGCYELGVHFSGGLITKTPLFWGSILGPQLLGNLPYKLLMTGS